MKILINISIGYVASPLSSFQNYRLNTGDCVQRESVDSWQFVSIMATLRSVCSNEDVYDSLICGRSAKPKRLIESFADGRKFGRIPLLNDQTNKCVALSLYYDDLEVIFSFLAVYT